MLFIIFQKKNRSSLCHFQESTKAGFYRYQSAVKNTTYIAFTKSGKPYNYVSGNSDKCINFNKIDIANARDQHPIRHHHNINNKAHTKNTNEKKNFKKNFNTKEINPFYDVRNREHRLRADEKEFKKLTNIDYSNDDYNPTLNEIAKRPAIANKFNNQHRKRHSNRLYNRGKPGLAKHKPFIN